MFVLVVIQLLPRPEGRVIRPHQLPSGPLFFELTKLLKKDKIRVALLIKEVWKRDKNLNPPTGQKEGFPLETWTAFHLPSGLLFFE